MTKKSLASPVAHTLSKTLLLTTLPMAWVSRSPPEKPLKAGVLASIASVYFLFPAEPTCSSRFPTFISACSAYIHTLQTTSQTLLNRYGDHHNLQLLVIFQTREVWGRLYS